jgi:hypothetical protein
MKLCTGLRRKEEAEARQMETREQRGRHYLYRRGRAAWPVGGTGWKRDPREAHGSQWMEAGWIGECQTNGRERWSCGRGLINDALVLWGVGFEEEGDGEN